MDQKLTIRGKVIGHAELGFIQQTIETGWEQGRSWVSRELCRHWDWRQPNGQIKDQVCRILLNELERRGLVELPPRKRGERFSPRRYYTPPQTEPNHEREPIEGSVGHLPAVSLKMVRRTAEEELWNFLVYQYHYKSYRILVGSHLKYMAFMGNRPVACLAWASSVFRIQARDQYLGWSKEERSRNIRFVANNSRFLILPWVKVRNLASHLLSLTAQAVSRDWMDFYGHPIYLLETFVETRRFRGTCYQAANWIRVGSTKGHAKREGQFYYHGNSKDVYVLPLARNFRQLLSGAGPC